MLSITQHHQEKERHTYLSEVYDLVLTFSLDAAEDAFETRSDWSKHILYRSSESTTDALVKLTI